MTKRNAIVPPPLPNIPATPPACAEARAIAKGEEAFLKFQKDLQETINENAPTWRKVLHSLKKSFTK